MDRQHQHDQFAEIAFREHPAYDHSIHEIPPIAYETVYFTTGMDKADKPKEATYEESLSRFHVQLQELRSRYAPFLQNLAPDPGIRRWKQPLTEFMFRYRTEEDNRFQRVLEGSGDWEKVSIPDFRGPTDEEGRWTGYYRTEFEYRPNGSKNRVFIQFKGVDYKASVYLNGKCLGSHEGFFSPFDFDVTDLLQAENTLIVEVQNDFPMMGVGGSLLDGDKIYAATGPGWDDPEKGWHHCPPGAGIYGAVYLEERPPLFIHDLFVRPDIDGDSVEIWIDAVNTTDSLIEHAELLIDIMPKNFTGDAYGPFRFTAAYAGPGLNYFRYRIELPSFKLWETESPYLYAARVRLSSGLSCPDVRDLHFGMRKFHQDEQSVPKGTLYLNNRPVILRGANEMGHLQQCIMQNNTGQLIDDILIAKMANMNFYRITQRPVQEEIYDYFDMLGMMHQCDLPTFGFIRRNQFCEAVRQTAEMERLIRSHPSSIMVSLINEPSRTEKRRKGHRFLHRDELEAFFVAARQAIYIENPDRVVKNTDGDYNPPTREGLPDFHCYNMWYTDNILTVGKMHKGFLPPVKEGWKAGCGEYGTEGLDNLDVMLKRYPPEWLPAGLHEPWSPAEIVKAQTYTLHGDWFAEQNTIAEWIRVSQRHQSLATKWMTDAWRRRADYIVSTAIHLLIDAWPSGWMKALVGVDRIPKPAYFVYQACLEPVRVHLRSDRWKVYGGEQLEIDAWLLNDSAQTLDGCRIIATLRDDAQDYAHYELPACGVSHTSSNYAGTIRIDVPEPAAGRGELYVDACLLNERGETLNRERFTFEAFAASALPEDKAVPSVAFLGAEAERLCTSLRLSAEPFDEGRWTGGSGPLVISSGALFEAHKTLILERVKAGAAVVLLRGNDGGQDMWDIEGSPVRTVKMKSRYVLAFQSGKPELQGLQEDDFSYFYDAGKDRIEGIADCHLEGEGLEELVFSYYYSRSAKKKGTLPVVANKRFGSGVLSFVGLPLDGRAGFNPALDKFMCALLHRHAPQPDGAAAASAVKIGCEELNRIV
ncbi:glycoside hydrolase family 2 [Paenibacillus sp. N4]|uniref:glycosyl hydrolase 2 galactose-binding domain-containing protein n=1 Tax=Paenibacillus vietnamensis TaxID=2590547 RepID=UPI001CD180A4|nr:glycoside hydrolase family 2 TIM barrel-domain containing protein [Paenibacillus vietnamensis]MCA0755602.1 glycoside hydrolase family 2 [Paenibacillus vietnamensis]